MAVAAPALEDAAPRGSARGARGVTDRVLVRAPNWVGDAVLSLPALRDVRRNFQAARLEVLARPAVADLYRAVAEVDAVRESGSFGADVQALRGAFDLGVLFPNSFGSALAASPRRHQGALRLRHRRPRVAAHAPLPGALRGPGRKRGVLLSRDARGRRAHGVGRARRVAAGARGLGRAARACWRRARPGGGRGPWLGINPGAAYGTAKRWIPERYAAVADRLAKRHGLRPVIMGGPGERAVAERIAAAMETPALDLCGRTTLGELLGVIAELRLLLTNDSGPMHLAAAVGTKIVAVIGSTDWRETHPFTDRAVLVREPVACAPCKLRECPIDHRCMTGVSVERVAAAAERMLEAA